MGSKLSNVVPVYYEEVSLQKLYLLLVESISNVITSELLRVLKNDGVASQDCWQI